MIDALPSTPSEQAVVQKLVACGLDRGGITVTWEAPMESMVVRFRHQARVTADKLPCISKAVPGDLVLFDDQPAL